MRSSNLRPICVEISSLASATSRSGFTWPIPALRSLTTAYQKASRQSSISSFGFFPFHSMDFGSQTNPSDSSFEMYWLQRPLLIPRVLAMSVCLEIPSAMHERTAEYI